MMESRSASGQRASTYVDNETKDPQSSGVGGLRINIHMLTLLFASKSNKKRRTKTIKTNDDDCDCGGEDVEIT